MTLPARPSAGWGRQGGAFSWQEGAGWASSQAPATPTRGSLLLAGRSWLGKFPGTCHPHPGAHVSAYSTRPITHRLQFPVPTDMCRQHLWVGHQPDLVVVPDLCLSMSQAGTPITRQVLSASGTAPQGQLLWVGRRLPESSDTWGRRQVCLDPAPCSLLQQLSFFPRCLSAGVLPPSPGLPPEHPHSVHADQQEGRGSCSFSAHTRPSLWQPGLLLTLWISFLLLGYPLQNSCLENPRDGGAWWAAVYGVAQSRTRLKRLSSNELSSQLL